MLTSDMLRPVQNRVIEELKDSLGVQLVMRMGGGKTVCALTAIRDLIEEGEVSHALVFAPVTVANDTWMPEARKWKHLQGLRVVNGQGGPAARSDALRSDASVAVFSIDVLPQVVQELKANPGLEHWFDLIVIDELSRFKNPRGQRFKMLNRNLNRFNAVWGLTGTPKPNSWEDQWAPLHVVSRGEAWGRAFDDWRREYFKPLDHMQRRWDVHDFAVPHLQRVVDEWTVTVPPEEDGTQTFHHGPEHDFRIEPTDRQAEHIETLSEELLVELGAEDLEDVEDSTLFADSEAIAVGKISQVMQGFLYEDGVAIAHHRPNPKLRLLDEVLKSLDGEPALICYHFQQDVTNLRTLPQLKHAPRLGGGVSSAQSKRAIDKWNAREVQHLLIHPASAGHGLNLQHGGSRIIWYSPTWSAELYAQTCMRLARPGQNEPVYSHRLLIDSWFEDRRVARVEHKLQEQDEFMQALRRL